MITPYRQATTRNVSCCAAQPAVPAVVGWYRTRYGRPSVRVHSQMEHGGAGAAFDTQPPLCGEYASDRLAFGHGLQFSTPPHPARHASTIAAMIITRFIESSP